MSSIFHGLLRLWMNYLPFMMHIRCIILYAVKLDFYGDVALTPPLLNTFPQRKKWIHRHVRTVVVALRWVADPSPFACFEESVGSYLSINICGADQTVWDERKLCEIKILSEIFIFEFLGRKNAFLCIVFVVFNVFLLTSSWTTC